MAEYSRRLSRSRSRGNQQGSTQAQSNLGMILKPSDGGGFGPSDGALVASMAGSLDGEMNSGPLGTEFLPQGGEGMTPFTWCDQCGASTEGECLIHGSIITVSDNKLPSRARLSLPSILSLQQVCDDGDRTCRGKEGVFAKNAIQARTQFGPLEAPPLQAGATLPLGVFDVRVLKSGHQEQLDLSQEELCNWMMFVRPGQYDQDTNVVAYQQADHIFYISTKVIAPKTELRVWYFPSYGQQIGKEPLPPLLPPAPVLPETSEEATELSGLEDQGPSMLGVGTRHSAEATKHVCPSCNTAFRSLALLCQHNCRVLDGHQTVDTSSRPARRKGRPRKVAGVGKRGRPVSQVVTNVVASPTVLPSVTTLIKTEIKTEVSVPDSTVPDPQQEVVARKRGRPKGSKNKPPVEGTAKPPRKPPVTVKQQRPKLECSFCGRSFYSQEQHRVHEAEHTGEKPYVCPVKDCGKGFGSSFKFRRHYLVHEQPQDRKCPFCDRKFNRVDHLKNHVATHNSNRQHWSCKKCGKKYLYHGTYEYHMALHDAEDAPQLVCRICSKSFSNREALIEHVHIHNRYKPDQNRSKNHKCPKCEKTFTTTKDVRRHMVTHTKDRSFLCDMCPVTFARKDHLRRHKRSHHKNEGLEEEGSLNAICSRSFKSEPFLNCALETEHLKGAESSLVKMVEKPQMVMDAHTSKVVLMPVPQQTEGGQQQQQLSLLSHPPNPTAAITPMQVALNPHQQQHEQQQQQILLQAGPYITTLPSGTEAQTIEVIADGNDQYNPSLPVKTTYRLPSGQVLAAAPSTPNPSFPLTPSLRQILSSCQPQQTTGVQQSQQQQQLVQQASPAQPMYSQQDSSAASTIMSMLGPSRVESTLLELAAGKGQTVYATDTNGQLKPVNAQWLLTDSSAATAVAHDSSAIQTTTDSGDHCYATGAATTSADGTLKLSSLPVVSLSDESLRLLQSNCQLAGAVGGNVSSTSIQPSSGSNLQASWESMSFTDMITPLSGSQPSIINLPVTVNVPITDGSVSVTASVCLSQTT